MVNWVLFLKIKNKNQTIYGWSGIQVRPCWKDIYHNFKVFLKGLKRNFVHYGMTCKLKTYNNPFDMFILINYLGFVIIFIYFVYTILDLMLQNQESLNKPFVLSPF